MQTLPVKKHFRTISDYHRFAGLPSPGNPLLSVINFEDLKWQQSEPVISLVTGFYSIVFKKENYANCRYGQKEEITVSEGGLHFMAPKQVLTIESDHSELSRKGWLILLHPDLIWNTHLANKIRTYDFFNYETNAGLKLTRSEIATVLDLIIAITGEVGHIHEPQSKDVILAQIELLLAYAERIHRRVYSSEKKIDPGVLERLETFIGDYFKSDLLHDKGVPTIQDISKKLNITSNHLSRILRYNTGQSTKSYLQDKLVELAKEKLSTTELSVSEIAYEIGFKAPQSLNKLFKVKTSLTPLEFRRSFR